MLFSFILELWSVFWSLLLKYNFFALFGSHWVLPNFPKKNSIGKAKCIVS